LAASADFSVLNHATGGKRKKLLSFSSLFQHSSSSSRQQIVPLGLVWEWKNTASYHNGLSETTEPN
jgi:hypothetical protein